MAGSSDIVATIIIIFLIVVIIYYYTQHHNKLIPNDGDVDDAIKSQNKVNYVKDSDPKYRNANMSDNVLGSLVSQYNADGKADNIKSESQILSASDPLSQNYGDFSLYPDNNNLFDDDDDDADDQRDFVYKKKQFTKRTSDDIKDIFNVQDYLPQEIEEDWFDIEPLNCTKKISGTHLIHPKYHMGVNTVNSSLKNATHDIRGDIPNPKINVSPFMNSSIEPDTNLRGLCNNF